MRTCSPLLVIIASVSLGTIVRAEAGEKGDADVRAWSQAFAAWVDVSHNIACPALKPRIDALTERLGRVQDAFLARHPDYVFPPMIYAKSAFVECEEGASLIARAEVLAGRAGDAVGQTR